jgi:hypothetical protein
VTRAPNSRIPRDEIRDAIIAQLATSPSPMSRVELDVETGYTGVQVATILRELVGLDVVAVDGTGRSSKYSLRPGVDVGALPTARVRRGF